MRDTLRFILDLFRDVVRKGDGLLLFFCVLANSFGLLLIFSATRYLGTNRYVIIQLLAMVIGIVAYSLFSLVDIEALVEKGWKFIAAFNILFLGTLLTPLAKAVDGNRNWLDLSKFHIPMNLQPAEIVKLTFILLLAYHIARIQSRGEDISSPRSVFQVFLHTMFMVGLIVVISGDVGMSLIYIAIFFIMCWSAGVKLRWFLGAGALIALAVAAFCIIVPHISSIWNDYRIMRIRVVLDHSLDPLGKGFQQTRSLLAIGSGKLFGEGFLQGIQTQAGYKSALPARHTDFIFAVCGEEFGMVGCIFLLLSLAAIILRCIYLARKAQSRFCSYICMGYAGMLLAQVALNVGMCLFVVPVVGLTLPFYSYGGSSLITMYASMGIVSGVKTKALPSWLQN